jgi:hypothetical protein
LLKQLLKEIQTLIGLGIAQSAFGRDAHVGMPGRSALALRVLPKEEIDIVAGCHP